MFGKGKKNPQSGSSRPVAKKTLRKARDAQDILDGLIKRLKEENETSPYIEELEEIVYEIGVLVNSADGSKRDKNAFMGVMERYNQLVHALKLRNEEDI